MSGGFVTVEQALGNLAQLEHLYKARPTQQTTSNLAATYFTIGETELAIPLGKRAVEMNPKDAGSWLNLGMMLKDAGDWAGSAVAVNRAYELNPKHPYTRMAYCESLFRRGEWKGNWALYDTTRPTKEGAAQAVDLSLDVKMWDGKEAVGELLVLGEGGTGDRINYTRFLPELTRRGINWKFYGAGELYPFYERLPWIPKDRLVKDGDDIEPTHWSTVFSLMANLNIRPQDVPDFPTPYTADPALVDQFKIERTDDKPVVGLAWFGAELWQGGRKIRSLTDFQAARLVCQTGDLAHYVNLQHGHKAGYPVTNIPFRTWQETAALIANLDQVVAVDTGTMWLAAAMGKEVHLLLSSNSDWKFLDRGPSVWGHNIHLYRNGTGGGFEHTIDEFVAAARRGDVFKEHVRNVHS